MTEQRETFAFECDHMRPVVRLDDGWHHIGAEGRVLDVPCSAGAYRVTATYFGEHTLDHLVLRDRPARVEVSQSHQTQKDEK